MDLFLFVLVYVKYFFFSKGDFCDPVFFCVCVCKLLCPVIPRPLNVVHHSLDYTLLILKEGLKLFSCSKVNLFQGTGKT